MSTRTQHCVNDGGGLDDRAFVLGVLVFTVCKGTHKHINTVFKLSSQRGDQIKEMCRLSVDICITPLSIYLS